MNGKSPSNEISCISGLYIYSSHDFDVSCRFCQTSSKHLPTSIQDCLDSLCCPCGHCNHTEQQFPAVVSSVLPVSDQTGYSNQCCLWDDTENVYLFYYTNFHGQDRLIRQIKMPVEQLVASLNRCPFILLLHWLFVSPTYINPQRSHSMPYTKLADLQNRLWKLCVVKERFKLLKLRENELSVMISLHVLQFLLPHFQIV